MADDSKIEWTDATWNVVTGCSVLTPGCTNCYAMRLAGTRLRHHPSRAGLTTMTKAGPVWNGIVRLNEEWLHQPRQWRSPRNIFVCAHSDLYHEEVPDAWLDRIHNVMLGAKQHTYQVLTKRSKRMREYWARFKPDGDGFVTRDGKNAMTGETRGEVVFGHDNFPPKGWWLGVSAERQKEADERIPDLLATPAAVRFVSAEPLLGPINFERIPHEHGWGSALEPGEIHGGTGQCVDLIPALDWIIVGGESGPGARPFDVAWARSIIAQCRAADVACFVKQLGANVTGMPWPKTGIVTERWKLADKKGGDITDWPDDLRVREMPTAQKAVAA